MITDKTLHHLSKLDSFLPVEDVDGVLSMLLGTASTSPAPSVAQPLLASVIIADRDRDRDRDSDTNEKRSGGSEEGIPEQESQSFNVFDILSPAPSGTPPHRPLYRGHWQSSFTVGARGKVSLVTPLGRFLAKAFVFAAEEGIPEQALEQYMVGLPERERGSSHSRDHGQSRPSSVRSRDQPPPLDYSRSYSGSCGGCDSGGSKDEEEMEEMEEDEDEDEKAIESERKRVHGVPFEYGMKYGLNEMYTAMSNATADMSASSSASMSNVRNRLSDIRNTISDISDLVQSVNVVEQYGGMGGFDVGEGEGEATGPLAPNPTTARFNAVSLMCEYALRCLSLAAQVEQGMWRRNGNAVANLIYNYNRPLLSRNFRDLDVASLQLGIMWLGPEIVLRNMVTVFEVFPEVLEEEREETEEETEEEVEGTLSETEKEDMKEDSKGLFGSPSIYGMYGKQKTPSKSAGNSGGSSGSGRRGSGSGCGNGSNEKSLRRARALQPVPSPSLVSVEDRGGQMAALLRVLCQLATYLPCDLTGPRYGSGVGSRQSGACQEKEEDEGEMVAVEEEESKEDSWGATASVPVPNSGSVAPQEGVELSLDRLVLHMVLSGQRTLSKLNTAKHMIGKDDAVSDAMIEESVRRVCRSVKGTGTDISCPHNNTKNNMSAQKKLSFDVNPSIAIALFDPEFPFLTSSDLHVATENMKAIYTAGVGEGVTCDGRLAAYPYHTGLCAQLAATWTHEEAMGATASSSSPLLPVVAKSALPLPHPFFQPFRERLLASTYLVQLLCSVAEFLLPVPPPTADKDSSRDHNNEKGKKESVNKKSVFGVKLGQDSRLKGKENVMLKPGPQLQPSVMGELASRLVHLATLRLHALPFRDAPTSVTATSVTDNKWEMRLLSALGALHVAAKGTGTGIGAGRGETEALSFTAPSGLDWVLQQHWLRGGVTAQTCLRTVGVDLTTASSSSSSSCPSSSLPASSSASSNTDPSATAEDVLQARKVAAQSRALAFIKKQVRAPPAPGLTCSAV